MKKGSNKTKPDNRLDRYMHSSQGAEQASDPPPPAEDPAPERHANVEPSNTEILNAIKETHTSMSTQLETIKVDLSLLRHDLQNL